jgi:hypothetical protein
MITQKKKGLPAIKTEHLQKCSTKELLNKSKSWARISPQFAEVYPSKTPLFPI